MTTSDSFCEPIACQSGTVPSLLNLMLPRDDVGAFDSFSLIYGKEAVERLRVGIKM